MDNESLLGKGSILFHRKFRFENGEIGEKLLILLNNPDPTQEPYLICRVTSQGKNKSKKFGCQEQKSLFFLPAKEDFFVKDTWVQLYEIYSFEPAGLISDHLAGHLEIKGNLKELTIRQLMNCIKKCQDISEIDKALILKN
jgi:hypothetical protein